MIKLTCITDNTVQRGSRYWGEHGLAFHVATEGGAILFDTGRSGAVLQHNLDELGLGGLDDVRALVLSHAHYDHTGGLATLLSQKPGLPLYAGSALFAPRFSLRDDQYESIGLALAREALSQQVDLRLGDAPTKVLPGVWTTGEIVERPEPEGRSAHHFVLAADREGWLPDPYQDDLSLVLEVQEGVVVLCGCCHAGLLNTLAHVRRIFQRPIVAVVGGTHLVDADEAYLKHVVDVLRDEYRSPRLYPNHCTGERAYLALAGAFGARVKTCPAGMTLSF